MSNKNKHLTFAERQIIETGIRNGSSKIAIAKTLGKDKSTIGKEIKLHRFHQNSRVYPVDCTKFAKCKNRNASFCNSNCPDYDKFICKHRDRTPGACNGCDKYNSCRYEKFKYTADIADSQYKETLVVSREGVNATMNQIRELGLLIKPLLEQGQSVYVILRDHPEIGLCEHTLYNYIEDGVFQAAGISINCLDLKRQVRRKMKKSKREQYKPRKDRSYLLGRKNEDYLHYMEQNPSSHVVEMDTVYNDVSKGPFIQTFIFIDYGILFAIYHEVKTSEEMLAGINLLEEILGQELFRKEVEVLVTDRGSEFVLAKEAETSADGSHRTNIFFCDAMASWQKPHIENVHLLLREICPNKTDLRNLGLTDQNKMDLVVSHINSYPRESLNDKTPFETAQFFCPELVRKMCDHGLKIIKSDDVILKPYLLK